MQLVRRGGWRPRRRRLGDHSPDVFSAARQHREQRQRDAEAWLDEAQLLETFAQAAKDAAGGALKDVDVATARQLVDLAIEALWFARRARARAQAAGRAGLVANA